MNHLKELRTAKGMTQGQLAEKVRHADPTIDQASISFLERGDIYPGERLMAALCRALECPEEALYSGIETAFIPAPEVQHSEAAKKLAKVLKFGAENAIKRQDLARILDTSDRKMREMIEQARQEGMVIANDQNGKGYYCPETMEELGRCYRQSRNRTLTQLRQQKYIRRRINGY